MAFSCYKMVLPCHPTNPVVQCVSNRLHHCKKGSSIRIHNINHISNELKGEIHLFLHSFILLTFYSVKKLCFNIIRIENRLQLYTGLTKLKNMCKRSKPNKHYKITITCYYYVSFIIKSTAEDLVIMPFKNLMKKIK